MARLVSMETLEKRIASAQSEVVKAKKVYDARVKELRDLMDKRDALKKERLLEAIMKSGKTYEEIMLFLRSDDVEE